MPAFTAPASSRRRGSTRLSSTPTYVASDVEVVARTADGEAVIEVRDRGPGLAADARASLFRPFFTTKERGTGLGLALAKKVADAHGGTLALEDREGGGTVARLAVPAAPYLARSEIRAAGE